MNLRKKKKRLKKQVESMRAELDGMLKQPAPVVEKRHRIETLRVNSFYNKHLIEASAVDIEEYIKENYNGHLDGLFGQSQGGLMVVELLSRGNIEVDVAVTDGVYVAHQGKLSGLGTYWMFKYYKDNQKPPKVMDVMIKLMGLDPKEAYGMFDLIYWNASYESIKRNLLENYTYHTNPSIANTKTKVYLWCGSKEPYAIKSHNILKKYLRNYEEEIMDGLGHGEFFLKHQEEMCKKLTKVYNQK